MVQKLNFVDVYFFDDGVAKSRVMYSGKFGQFFLFRHVGSTCDFDLSASEVDKFIHLKQ